MHKKKITDKQKAKPNAHTTCVCVLAEDVCVSFEYWPVCFVEKCSMGSKCVVGSHCR
jgi:hypothetical protein